MSAECEAYAESLERRLEQACDEIVALRRERDEARAAHAALIKNYGDVMDERNKALVMLAHTPPYLTAAREEADELRREIQVQQARVKKLDAHYARSRASYENATVDLSDRLSKAEAERDDAKTVEAFWRRAAEQALRLWDRAQDDLEEACTIGLYGLEGDITSDSDLRPASVARLRALLGDDAPSVE